MNADGFVVAGSAWHNRLKNFFVDAWYLRDGEIDRGDAGFPFKLEQSLKERGVVPKDAFLWGYFFEPHRNGVTLRFAHRDFDEVQAGAIITCEDVGNETRQSTEGGSADA